MAIVTLETERLRFRAFEPNDLEKYTGRIFGDPVVMKYLPARSDALPIERAQRTMQFFNIVALAVPENIASRRVMEHIGLKYERETQLFGLHCVYYALNRNEYKENRNPVNPSEHALLSR